MYFSIVFSFMVYKTYAKKISSFFWQGKKISFTLKIWLSRYYNFTNFHQNLTEKHESFIHNRRRQIWPETRLKTAHQFFFVIISVEGNCVISCLLRCIHINYIFQGFFSIFPNFMEKLVSYLLTSWILVKISV